MAFARPLLPLFRPVASLRPTQVCRFSQCARLSQTVNANSKVSDQTTKPETILAYFVQRTKSYQMPVYTEAKRGGNLKQTKLRKISGDIKRLGADLQAYLELSDRDIVIKHDTQSIIVKGHHKFKIESFLESRGL